jgi:predicted NBD/HSP70 family sugar kinase
MAEVTGAGGGRGARPWSPNRLTLPRGGRVVAFEERLFWAVFDRQECSREELRRLHEVSSATISRAVALLHERGLVSELPASSQGRGRRRGLLRVNPSLVKLLGLEIDFDRVTAVVVDATGGLLGRGARSVEARDGIQAILAPADEAIAEALRDAGVSGRAVRYLGVGHPGAFDLETGRCLIWAGAPAWTGTPVRSVLEQRYGWETVLDDRSRVYALAERRASPGDGRHPYALYVVAGTGVGAGIFIDGRLYRGASGGGTEIGHLVVDPSGPLCACGMRGCVEAYAAAAAILRGARQLPGADSPAGIDLAPAAYTVEEVARSARLGEPPAAATMERAAWALGSGIANAVQLLNPSLVVLAGRVARAGGRPMLERIEAIVRARCVPALARNLNFRLAPARKDIAAVGAALVAAEMAIEEALRERLYGRREPACPGRTRADASA